MQVRDVMTTTVVTASPHTRLIDAVNLMLDRHVTGLPIVDEDGHLVGMLTEGDLMRRSEIGTERHQPRWIELFRTPGIAAAYAKSHGQHVADVMTRQAAATDEDASLIEAVGLMEQHQVKRLPVVRDGRLAGIVSRSDVLRGLARSIDEAPAKDADDAEISNSLRRELGHQQWMPAMARFTVRSGIVEFYGVIPDQRYRDAMRIAAENTPGVKAVRDYLVTIPAAEPTPLIPGHAKFIPPEDGPGLSAAQSYLSERAKGDGS